MMKILPWGLLVALLVANGAYFYGQGSIGGPGEGSPPPKTDPVVAELALTEAQQADLDGLRQRLSDERKAMSELTLPLRREMLTVLVAEDFDSTALSGVLDEMSDARRAFFLGVMENLHGYLQGLDESQRATFLDLAEDQGFLRRMLMPREDGGS